MSNNDRLLFEIKRLRSDLSNCNIAYQNLLTSIDHKNAKILELVDQIEQAIETDGYVGLEWAFKEIRDLIGE